MDKCLYKTSEAATYLAVSVSTVRKLAKACMIEQRYIGTCMLITRASLDEFAESLPMLPDPDFWD